jgi:hypothetical protein
MLCAHIVIVGQFGNGFSSGLFKGEEDSPFPKSAGMMKKYLFGLRVNSGPMSQMLSVISMDH